MTINFEGRSVLVVGGCGFIGSNLVRRLASLGARTTVVDSLVPWGGGNVDYLYEVRNEVTTHHFDVRAAGRRRRLFRKHQTIFVVMGSVGHVESMRNPKADLLRNCAAHLGLLEVVRRENPDARLVVTGTRQIYGRPQRLPVDETHPIAPTDVNGVHLFAVESYYRLYHETYGLRSACLRLTNTYGPRMSLQHACYGFAPTAFRQALRGEAIRLFGDGLQSRDFNYVDDVVEALLAAAGLEMERHEAYNLGEPAPTSLREFCNVLTSFAPAPLEFEPFPPDRRRIDVGNYAASFDKFRRSTGWQPAVPLHEGIRRTVDYYQDHPQEFVAEPIATSRTPPTPEPRRASDAARSAKPFPSRNVR